MSVKSAPYYWVVCDDCGASAASGDYSAWSDKESAEIEPEAMEWLKMGDKHYCDGCRAQFDCDECGELKTECECEGKNER